LGKDAGKLLGAGVVKGLHPSIVETTPRQTAETPLLRQ
jgi:hypothetical protein